MNNFFDKKRDKADLFPFDGIKQFDDQGKAYWTARELYKQLEYKSYQKFSNLIHKCINIIRSYNIENEEPLFIQKDRLVNIGSKAKRVIEDYHLYREMCLLIAQNGDKRKQGISNAINYFSCNHIDFNGAECDLNCQKDISKAQYDNISLVNHKYWEELNTKSSLYYQDKIKELSNIKELTLDNTFLGHNAPHHIMYKLNPPLKSKDGCREYEFLIEFDIFEPTVGIYYGCKGLILNGNIDEQISIFNNEWHYLKYEISEILDNTFPGKSFQFRFKPTNNANNFTYWPFWISLYEEENINDVAVRALKLIKSRYIKFLNNENTQSTSIRNNKTSSISRKDKRTIEYPTIVAFTNESYYDLLSKSKDEKKFKANFDLFLSKASSEEIGIIKQNRDYEYAWKSNVETSLFAYIIQQLFHELKEERIYTKNGIPWLAISKIFLDRKNQSFGKDVLKNSINECNKKIGQKKHNENTNNAKEIIKLIYVK